MLKQTTLSASDQAQLEQLSEQFYSVVPHHIGRSAAGLRAAIIRTPTMLDEKQQLVQLMRDLVSLGASLDGQVGLCLRR